MKDMSKKNGSVEVQLEDTQGHEISVIGETADVEMKGQSVKFGKRKQVAKKRETVNEL